MVRINSTSRTEEMMCRSAVEAVACQHVLTLQECDAAQLGGDGYSASHPAVRTRATADRIEAVTKHHLETHCSAMALAVPSFYVACHIASAPNGGNYANVCMFTCPLVGH